MNVTCDVTYHRFEDLEEKPWYVLEQWETDAIQNFLNEQRLSDNNQRDLERHLQPALDSLGTWLAARQAAVGEWVARNAADLVAYFVNSTRKTAWMCVPFAAAGVIRSGSPNRAAIMQAATAYKLVEFYKVLVYFRYGSCTAACLLLMPGNLLIIACSNLTHGATLAWTGVSSSHRLSKQQLALFQCIAHVPGC